MSVILGMSCYGVGLLPLSVSLSKAHLARLTTLGSGLFIGTALGVIIPEGIEGMVESDPDNFASKIAIWILLGFTVMFVVEQHWSAHAKPSQHAVSAESDEVNFDIDLEELEREEGMSAGVREPASHTRRLPYQTTVQRANPLTLGLVVHSFVDGYALGVAATKSQEISMIIFLAIVIHKAPTALALMSSLLSLALPVSDCKRHLLYFSISTPLAAVVSYLVQSYHGGRAHGSFGAPLLFSGGTFLYVATVLQSVSDHAPLSSPNETRKITRTMLLLMGMFIPLVISNIMGPHSH
ncbi:Zinc/iron permease [Hygrophoropsis aurantiaca]|uniref:Zinc/iron permease n=1 Tax=Hygrophoropsis aurantiaca TaxID=72124 RepID=A0ACB8ALY4_9AGAM|nr:Zinc/iron permease [Hygrophoropsis aurantiaca]